MNSCKNAWFVVIIFEIPRGIKNLSWNWFELFLFEISRRVRADKELFRSKKNTKKLLQTQIKNIDNNNSNNSTESSCQTISLLKL